MDAYDLQGRNGWQLIAAGESFAGRSAGFQVLTDGTFSATCAATGTANAFADRSLIQGMFIGGTITALTVGASGDALVYPLDSDYTITGS